MSQSEVVILSAVRTAIGDFGGGLKDIAPTELASHVIAEAVTRSGLSPEEIDHCIIGSVLHCDTRDMYLSRAAAIAAGLPVETPALTLNRMCGSGLQSIVSAAQMILLGDCDTAVAGGADSMSRAPYWLPDARFGARMGHKEMVDPMLGSLTCPIGDTHMAITGEKLAKQYRVTRKEQDHLAAESHRRALRAIEEGRFISQIAPIEIKTRKGVTVFDKDEHPRADSTLENLANLQPVFQKENGTITAGNASSLNDGAAAVVVMRKADADAKGLKSMARLVAYAHAAVDPSIMGIGPVPAVRKLLQKTGLSIDEIDVWEVNEAFAAQVLAVYKELKLDSAKVNPNGSGISLGHPLGATGTILAVKALYELDRIGGRFAVATLCIGGGQGIALLFERCE